MVSETKILEAIFGPSIPTEMAAVLPEIMTHIRAIDGLLQGKPRQYHPRISNPAISGPINRRIGELYAEYGKWPLVAAAICQEFNVTISPDACRGRYRDAVARQKAYAAMSGSAIPGATELPTELPTDNQQVQACTDEGNIICRDGAERQEGDGALRSAEVNVHERSVEAIKTEAIRLYQEGQDVKAIAEKLGVRAQWLRGILTPVCAPEPNSPGSPDSSPQIEPAPLSEAEINAELIRLRDTGMSPKEIRDAMHHKGVEFGLTELRDRLYALTRKALQDRKAARAASEPEIPPDCTRAQLDAVMWRLWDHGKGKTPDEISDMLCNAGYSYGTAAVERRLRQQGAEL